MSDPERPSDQTTRHIVTGSTESSGRPQSSIPQEGQTIGEYMLMRKIGGGGMGLVYEAEHMRLKRRVAVKLISESYIAKPQAAPRFFREIEAAGKLEHPHIVQATDAGVADGIPYLVMEYIAGADLARIVRQHGPLPPLAAIEAIEQAGNAVEHIHNSGMVHRDIKPSNLLLSTRGVVKLADLGLTHFATGIADDEHITASGDIVGTVEYMAPEQARDSKLIDQRADIYSLGCCLHFLLCGSPVFRADSRVDCLLAHRTEEVPELISWYGVPLPRSLHRLFRDTLGKKPENRPQSMREVLDRLRQSRDELQPLVARSPKQTTTTIRGLSLPIDANLESTARLFLTSVSMAAPDSSSLGTTVQIHHEPHVRPFRFVALTGCLIVAGVLAVFSSRQFRSARSITGAALPSKGEKNGASVSDISPSPSRVQFVLDAHPGGAVFNVRFSEDGKHLLSCGSDGFVRVWDVEARKQLRAIRHERGINGLHVIDVASVPNTPHAVSVSYNGFATVWNWHTGERVRQFKLHRNQVEAVAWISGTKVLTTGRDDAIFIWDTDTGSVIAQLENSHSGGVRAASIDSPTRRAITADYSGTVIVWNIEPGKEQFLRSIQVASESHEIWSIDWIPDSDQVAIGGIYASGRPLLVVCDATSGEVVREFTELTGRVYDVRVSRDGRHLFSAADEVHVWALDSDQTAAVFEFTRHNDNVFSVDQSPDGALLASGGTDGTVRVFEWRETAKLSDDTPH